jgi:murein endopeptidase
MALSKSLRISFLTVAITLLTTPLVMESQAQHGALLSPSALRSAAVLFSPLPNSTLLTPELVRHVERLASKERWRTPQAEPTWKVELGSPVVQTRRLDEMWHTVAYPSKYKLLGQGLGPMTQLQVLNPEVDFDHLEEGQQILVWKRSDSVPRSWGEANRGRLYNGEPLPPGESYTLLYPHRTFGTYYTISEIVRVLDSYKERYPDAKPLVVGDVSVKHGRRIKPHKSHQSGRDVDITYPRLREPANYQRFHHIARRDFDVEKAFWLIKQFVDSGNVEYIFVDRRWQRELREYAQAQGATDEWLDAVFEYRSARSGLAIVRHERGHARHFHVRFKCQETDTRCR